MKTTDWDVGRDVLCFLQCGYKTFQALDIFLATNIVDKCFANIGLQDCMTNVKYSNEMHNLNVLQQGTSLWVIKKMISTINVCRSMFELLNSLYYS